MCIRDRHTVERNARQPFIQLVGQFLQLAGMVYVVIQFLGQSPAIASLTGILDLRPHIHVCLLYTSRCV